MATDTPYTWAIVPFIDLPDMTIQTALDLLAQTSPCRVLLVSQGSSEETLSTLREFAEQHHPQVLLWSYQPALPSLSAVWNRALRWCWELGATEALVVNNDVRLHPVTLGCLKLNRARADALFISAVGVREADWERWWAEGDPLFTVETTSGVLANDRGGPDFSCFLQTKAGHDRYPFDEGCIPAFMEDCDAHRRYMLGGDASRIYSINLPFLHIAGGSRTINQSPEARERFERAAGIGRAHYVACWGGPPNQERFTTRGDPTSAQEGVTNPELQRWYREHPE